MKTDKFVKKYRSQFGSEQEQKQSLVFLQFNKQAGNHPFFNVPRSMKIKNKRGGK